MERDFKRYPVTYGLMAVCILVYIITTLRYGIDMSTSGGIDMGAYNPVLVWEYHQYYRLLTANFLHFGILHIVVNMYSLQGLGCFMERTLGRSRYIIVIFFSALFTNLLPALVYLIRPGFEANVIAGGISGVIFGLIGALGAYAYLYENVFKDIFMQLLPNILLMFAISFLVPSISFSGHLCGFIGGFLSTYLILESKNRDNRHNHYIN